jgi:hypothetical protein
VPEVNKVRTAEAAVDEAGPMDVMDAPTTHAYSYSAAEVTAAASVGSTQWDRDEDRRGSE